MIHRWKAEVIVLQETKLERDAGSMVPQIWGAIWVDYVYQEASGTRGGILIMCHKRRMEGELVCIGQQSISCKMTILAQNYSWLLTGVYASNCRRERRELWWELAGHKGLCDDPWVVCGDFNTARYSDERRHNNTHTREYD